MKRRLNVCLPVMNTEHSFTHKEIAVGVRVMAPLPTAALPPLTLTLTLTSANSCAPPTDRSMRKGGASAASAPAAKSKKPSYKFALTLALYYLPGDDAVDPGATSIVRSIQGAVFSGDVWDARSLVRAPVAAAPLPGA